MPRLSIGDRVYVHPPLRLSDGTLISEAQVFGFEGDRVVVSYFVSEDISKAVVDKAILEKM